MPVCDRDLPRLLTCKTDLNVTYSLFHATFLFSAVKTRQESTPINGIVLRHLKLKWRAQNRSEKKKIGGQQKFFALELRPPHFQLASYAHEFTTSVRLWHRCTSVAKRILIIKCTKFGHLILRKIIKILATRCQILRLKCTKFDFGWGSAPDPARGAYSAHPDP